MSSTTLTSADLIPDEPLDRMVDGHVPDSLDTLNHRHVAKRIAELAKSASGQVNIALFGPWGSGKSSFYGLLRRELETGPDQPVCIRFDAWKHAGESFPTNFLAQLASATSSRSDITEKLFRSSKTVTLPFGIGMSNGKGGSHWRWVLPVALITLFFVGPLLWSIGLHLIDPVADFWSFATANIAGWAGFAASGTLVLVVAIILIDLTKVTVQESAPSFLVQFSQMFDTLVAKESPRRFVIFIDELDRCGPQEVMQTLEGLRTFLGHERCTFVVAFDRDAVSSTIAHHSKNDVPLRPDQPYYSTSGEYLDKIFQFQVSLPPQTNRTFRRYALSLVETKGGVWAELRTDSPRSVEEVVSILSPRHIVSPRRTKVLLNDFAINMRIFESLDFDIRARAAEIAVYTVLQTEFPYFWNDLEKEPDLLGFVARGMAPKRDRLNKLFKKYSAGGERQLLDDIVTPKSEAGTGGADTEGTQLVSTQLDANLDSFLRRVVELGIPLPSADLILMHSGGNLLSFEDSAVYNTILSAPEISRSETMSALRSASPADITTGTKLVAEMIEAETTAEAESLTVLAGELVALIEETNRHLVSSVLTQAWLRKVQQSPESVARMSIESLVGYAQVLNATDGQPRGAEMAQAVDAYKPEALPSVFKILLGRLSREEFLRDGDGLARIALRRVREDPTLLEGFLVVQDGLEANALGENHTESFVKAFVSPEPTKTEPESRASTAVAAAETANAEARAEFEREVEQSRVDIESLLQHTWDELNESGPTRKWLVDGIASASREHITFYALLTAQIDHDIARGLAASANELLWKLIASESRYRYIHDWVSRLDGSLIAPGDLVEETYRGLLDEVDSKARDATRLKSAQAAKMVAGILHDPEIQPFEDIVHLVAKLVDDRTIEVTRDSLEIFNTLIDSVVAFPEAADFRRAATEARVRLYISTVDAADPSHDIVFLLQETGRLSSEEAQLLNKAAPEGIDKGLPATAMSRVQLTLAAQSRLQVLGVPITPLGLDTFALALSHERTPAVLAAWVSTGAEFRDIRVALTDTELLALSPTIWESFSSNSTHSERTLAWKEGLRVGLKNAGLRAIAGAGVERDLYQELGNETVTGSSITSRTRAFEKLRTLPQATRLSAEQSFRVAQSLISSGRKADVSIVYATIRDNDSAFSPTQRKQLRARIDPWLSAAGTSIGKAARKDLEQKGFATTPKKWPWSK